MRNTLVNSVVMTRHEMKTVIFFIENYLDKSLERYRDV